MRSCAIGAVLCMSAVPAIASAQLYTFDGLLHGEIVTNQFEPALSISGVNFNRPFDIVAGFDTTTMGGPDPDLQGPPWAGGNLAISATEVVLGSALILAEDDADANNDGLLDTPNDEGDRPAGTIELGFAAPIPLFGLDIIDIEGVVRETSSLDFYEGGQLVGTVSFADFEDTNSPFYDPTISFGNNTANRIQPITADAFGAAGFDRIVINVGGSSAYDTFVVPAPASASLLALGAVIARRRRR